MHIVSTTRWKNLCKFTQIMCNLHKSWSTRGPRRPRFANRKSHLHKSLLNLNNSPHAHTLVLYYYQLSMKGTKGGYLRKKMHYRSRRRYVKICVPRELRIAIYVFGKLYNQSTQIYANVICVNRYVICVFDLLH